MLVLVVYKSAVFHFVAVPLGFGSNGAVLTIFFYKLERLYTLFGFITGVP